MLAPSSKDGISTYTAEKIEVLGSCDLFVVHPETRCLKEVTFQVVNHGGSVIVSCVTGLELGLTQLHSVFNDSVPDYGRLLYSEADHPNKCKHKDIESSSNVSDNASPIEVQSTVVPDVTATEVHQCVTQMGQQKNKLMQCPAQDDTVVQDKKCQKVKSAHTQPQEPKSYILQSRKAASKCKKEHQKDQSVMLPHKPATMVKKPGQATQKKVLKNKNCSNVDMWPQKPSYSDEQLKKPVTKYKYKYQKHQEQVICQDKQSQETEQTVCESQESPSTQCCNRQPVKQGMKNNDVQSKEPATETKSILCSDKQCHSTRCFKKFTRSDNIQSPVRPKYTYDKNCQFMQPVKPKSVVWLAKPAVYEDTRKMGFKPNKRIQMQFNQMNDSSIEKVQSQCAPKKCKKMQLVMQPVKKLSPDVTSTTKVQAQKRNINVNI